MKQTMLTIKSDRLRRKVALAENAVGTRQTAREALDCLDLTSLTGEEDTHDIATLCDIAKYNRLASVCVYPQYIEAVAAFLKGSPVIPATVINFPFGNLASCSHKDATVENTSAQTTKAIAAGARQIDIVFPYSDFLEGRLAYVREILDVCRIACADEAKMKVILETAAYMTEEDLAHACNISIEAGAHCLKSCTGKHKKGGVTLESAAILMHSAYQSRRQVGIKLSGGIKTVDECAQYMVLARSIFGWNVICPERFRFGASNLLDTLLLKLGRTLETHIQIDNTVSSHYDYI